MRAVATYVIKFWVVVAFNGRFAGASA